ncbi:MAG TPA: SRPBCC family protein [Verrucomicrobiae bacterium]|nr:SRPBCC family protein [Verrucomicrobiae bacterium]
MNGLSKQRSRPFPERQQQFARALGWFSIGLGAAEVLCPRLLARLIGVKPHKGLFRFLGVREITSGVGILSESKYPAWVWSRVGGDAMDLALMGLAFASGQTNRSRLCAATAAVAGVTALDIICSEDMTRTRKAGGANGVHKGNIRVKSAVTINRPKEELYRFWQNFENLPRFMYYLDSVRVTEARRSHWIAKGPGGKKVEWDSEVIDERPNELIAWRTLPGSQVHHNGIVRFEAATGGRGTVVRVEMEYKPPGGVLGATVAKLMHREPGQELHDSLRYFRQLMETGVIPTTVGQSAGRPASTSKKFDFPMPKPSRSGTPQFTN